MGNVGDPNVDAAIVNAAVVELMEEEADEEEVVAMAIARISAEILMELEEGEGFESVTWVYITVNIDEYHEMNNLAFKLHFRMSRTTFEELLVTVGNHLVIRRHRRPLQDILLMVIWLMATPDSFRSVALRFGVSPGTLYYFYGYMVKAFREMSATIITWPSREERVANERIFRRASGFPGVVGSIDCTHVFITAPVNEPGPFFSRHHSYSINVQAVVDANLMVRHLHVGEPGSMNDRRVFRRSPLYADLLNNHDETFLSAGEHLVGDGAYVLTDFMMIPFPNTGHLTPEQGNFNRRLSQCRVRVENAFARGKGKWRRLKFLHARNPAIVVDHITASFVLHNFLLQHGDQIWDENELERPIRDDQVLAGVNGDDDQGADHLEQLEAAAERRGAERRLHIMNNILVLPGEEVEEEEDEEED